jgi:8-oxo-dGTP pyrophosphatase MutT (NUDIX family)
VASLDEIRRALQSRSPASIPAEDRGQAAVAMVLRPVADGTQVLFIERARRAGDPWSGHMAFPGGRVDPGDADPRAAAERETLEEVGVSLASAELLGRLDDKQGNPRTHPALVISAFVYALHTPPPLIPNYEVECAFWFPLSELSAPRNHVPHLAYGELEFPGILVGEPERHVVWGLTYSFLESFFDVLGRPLPDRWTPPMRRQMRPARAR